MPLSVTTRFEGRPFSALLLLPASVSSLLLRVSSCSLMATSRLRRLPVPGPANPTPLSMPLPCCIAGVR